MSRRRVQIALVAMFFLFAAADLAAEFIGRIPRPIVKTMPVLCIAAYLWMALGARALRMTCAVLASATGDVLLAFDRGTGKLFVPGLIAFLISHLFYISVFAPLARFDRTRVIRAVVFVVIGGTVLSVVARHAGALVGPVVVYGVVLLSMAVSAALAWRKSRRLAIGAVIFVSSDSSLAWNRFVAPIPLAGFVIMGTYYVAQFLIAQGYLRELDVPRLVGGTGRDGAGEPALAKT